MNFYSYVQRQKNLIRERRDGETYLMSGGKVFKVRPTDELMYELNSLKGLNTKERAGVVIIRRSAVC